MRRTITHRDWTLNFWNLIPEDITTIACVYFSGGSWVSQRGECANSRWVVRKLIFLQMFRRKLHENERIRTDRERRFTGVPPWIRHCICWYCSPFFAPKGSEIQVIFKILHEIIWFAVAHPRGCQGRTRPGVQILSFSCSFQQNNSLAHLLLGVAAPLRKLLDPPLIWTKRVLEKVESVFWLWVLKSMKNIQNEIAFWILSDWNKVNYKTETSDREKGRKRVIRPWST